MMRQLPNYQPMYTIDATITELPAHVHQKEQLPSYQPMPETRSHALLSVFGKERLPHHTAVARK